MQYNTVQLLLQFEPYPALLGHAHLPLEKLHLGNQLQDAVAVRLL